MRENDICVLNETREVFDMLQKRKTILEIIVNEKKMELKKAPDGKINIKRSTKYNPKYYIRRTSTQINGEYLRRGKNDLILKLVQKEYNTKCLEQAEKELKNINLLLKKKRKDFQVFYEWIPEELRDDIKVVLKSDKQIVKEWRNVEYKGLPFEEEDDTEYYSDKNERMRSRIEVMIANALSRKDIPYRYEYKLRFDNGECIYPDFTILNVKERKEYIWEHLGKMDDEGYINRQLKKIKMYEREGFYLGKNLLLTYETKEHPVSTRTIEKMIQEYFG